MIALAIAGALGLFAVVLFVAAALLTIVPRRLPMIAPGIAVLALLATIAMVLSALLGVLQLVAGVVA
ncbi:hypothetical protein [Microcella sp.]|uniref:hypothetical protein n=1 Tax=Microcella sp. TaxID=1913979 RepID=UPI00391CFB64